MDGCKFSISLKRLERAAYIIYKLYIRGKNFFSICDDIENELCFPHITCTKHDHSAWKTEFCRKYFSFNLHYFENQTVNYDLNPGVGTVENLMC
jgi:hypothetical protein